MGGTVRLATLRDREGDPMQELSHSQVAWLDVVVDADFDDGNLVAELACVPVVPQE